MIELSGVPLTLQTGSVAMRPIDVPVLRGDATRLRAATPRATIQACAPRVDKPRRKAAMKTSAAIVIVPYGSLETFKPAKLPATRTGRRAPSDSVIAGWLPLARFPAGIQPEHLAALLAAYAQAEPRVLK